MLARWRRTVSTVFIGSRRSLNPHSLRTAVPSFCVTLSRRVAMSLWRRPLTPVTWEASCCVSIVVPRLLPGMWYIIGQILSCYLTTDIFNPSSLFNYKTLLLVLFLIKYFSTLFFTLKMASVADMALKHHSFTYSFTLHYPYCLLLVAKIFNVYGFNLV